MPHVFSRVYCDSRVRVESALAGSKTSRHTGEITMKRLMLCFLVWFGEAGPCLADQSDAASQGASVQAARAASAPMRPSSQASPRVGIVRPKGIDDARWEEFKKNPHPHL